MEHELYVYIGNNCDHWNGNKMFKENFEAMKTKIFSRFTTTSAVLGTSQIEREILRSETGGTGV